MLSDGKIDGIIAQQKVLVLCNANLNRSPTVARFLREFKKELDIKDAGVYSGYPNQINKDLVDWADIIFVMDLEQYRFINEHYEKHPPVFVLGVSDCYDRYGKRLYELLFWYFKIPVDEKWISENTGELKNG